MTAQTSGERTISVGGRTFRQPFGMEDRINWMLLALIGLLLLYWIYVISLERVDGTIVLARLFYRDVPLSEAARLPIPGVVALLVEWFHPRVLRHFIPIILGWWLAMQAAISLIQAFYDCPDRKTARDFLRRHRHRTPRSGGAAYEVTPHTLDELKDESVLLRVGGPVNVAVPSGHSIVTELNARFDRIIGSGTHPLVHFEYVYSVVPLYPQERSAADVSLTTKEGIPVTADVQVAFRVDPGQEPPTRARPFPYDPEATHKVAYAVSVLPNGSESSWEQIPLSKVKRSLAHVVARYSLDELLVPDTPERDMHLAVRNEVESEVSAELFEEGIHLVQLNIGRITPPEEVSRQYTEYWLAAARKQDQISRANGAAQALQQVELAQAEAEVAMLQALVESVRHVHDESPDGSSGYLLALRLVETLEKVVQKSQLRLESGDESAIELVPRLDSLQAQLSRLEHVAQKTPPSSEDIAVELVTDDDPNSNDMDSDLNSDVENKVDSPDDSSEKGLVDEYPQAPYSNMD